MSLKSESPDGEAASEPTAAPSSAPSARPASSPSRADRSVSVTMVVILVVAVAAAAIGGTAAYYALKPAPAPVVKTVVQNVTVTRAGGNRSTNVTDDLGRYVEAPVNAQRIVVLAPNIMDVVYRLGLRDRVVAVGCTASLAGGILNEYTTNQTRLWGLSNSTCITDYPSLNTEAVANATPQLVLATTITSEAAVETLTDTYGLPVVILAPTTMDGIVGDVRLMAQLFPADAANCTALEAQLQSTLQQVASEDENLSSAEDPVPSVLLSYYFDSGGYYTFGPGTFGASLIDLAGGSNAASSSPLAYGEINATVVLNDQPTVVMYGTEWNDAYVVSGETTAVWTTAPYWSQLTGSKIGVDVALITEADPTMILWLPWLQHDLYPTLVSAP